MRLQQSCKYHKGTMYSDSEYKRLLRKRNSKLFSNGINLTIKIVGFINDNLHLFLIIPDTGGEEVFINTKYSNNLKPFKLNGTKIVYFANSVPCKVSK